MLLCRCILVFLLDNKYKHHYIDMSSMSPVASPLFLTGEMSPEAAAFESPPAYVSDKLLEMNANSPLKSRQVQLGIHQSLYLLFT